MDGINVPTTNDMYMYADGNKKSEKKSYFHFMFFLPKYSLIPYLSIRLMNKCMMHKLPVILLLAVPRWLFCFGSLVVLDVVFRYLSLFFLYINTKIGKNRCLMLD